MVDSEKTINGFGVLVCNRCVRQYKLSIMGIIYFLFQFLRKNPHVCDACKFVYLSGGWGVEERRLENKKDLK